MSVTSQMKKLKFDGRGLVSVIVQDCKTKEVLMLGHMNKKAFSKTLETGKVHFFSRSRRKIWLKGEESGHYQTVHQILLDCDDDALLIKVHQKGGACHKGYGSCFFRMINDKGKSVRVVKKKIFDPKKVYGKHG